MPPDLPVSQTCVFIPTLNEATTIGDVVIGFRDQGFDNVLVYDGQSTDGTAGIARDAGARVVQQPPNGKGRAVQHALNQTIDAQYIVMIDGDGTYHPTEVDRLLDPLVHDTYDHVIGNRFAGLESGAMPRMNKLGNRLFNSLFAAVYHEWYSDILSGYRAFTQDAIETMSLTEPGFGIETELTAQSVLHDIPTTVVPITYSPRPDESQTKLHPLRDGAVICSAIFRCRMN